MHPYFSITRKLIIRDSNYPFGSGMAERGKNYGGNYRFGINTQEKETELGEGVSSAEFWFYDGKLGRRWNVDPVSQVSRSNYSTLGNSPIIFTDQNGDKIDPASNSIVGRYKLDVNSKITAIKTDGNYVSLMNRLGQLQTDYENRSQEILNDKYQIGQMLNDEVLNNLQAEMSQIEVGLKPYNEQISFYTDRLKVLSDLEKSDWTYRINEMSTSAVGGLSYNGKSIVMSFYSNDFANLAHELEHASEFDKGKTAIYYSGGGKSLTSMDYDIHEEVRAYQVQLLYDKKEFQLLWPEIKSQGDINVSWMRTNPSMKSRYPLTVLTDDNDLSSIVTEKMLEYFFAPDVISEVKDQIEKHCGKKFNELSVIDFYKSYNDITQKAELPNKFIFNESK